ncbi:MAG: DsrE family protein [Proteobacteria bacterium]|nr:DsrE family protein [Pseudomonadota bacterium]
MSHTLRTLLACLAMILAVPAGAADTKPGAPADVAAKPLRVVVQISENQPAIWNLALNNIHNVQKELGAKNIEVELVAYGPGLAILRDDSVVANRVQEAMSTGVRFVACRNTMQGLHITEAEMIPGISYAQAGVIEIIRKQMEGYAYLRP